MKPAMMQDWKYSKIYMRTYKRGMHPIASFNKQRTVSLTFEINPDFPKCLAPKTVKHFGRQRNPKKRERIALLF